MRCANDSNTSQFFIPAYTVWDLTGQHTLFRQLSFIWGVNNIFDSQYFARIRNDGIDPAMPRNYYLGARLDY